MTSDTQRIDKWLWYARFIKTRSAATRLVGEGRIRVNSTRVTKPSHQVSPGDVLTFTLNHNLKVVRVLAPGTRRGPAPEACELYEDLTREEEDDRGSDAASQKTRPAVDRPAGTGRPTKKERRDLDAWRERDP